MIEKVENWIKLDLKTDEIENNINVPMVTVTFTDKTTIDIALIHNRYANLCSH